MDNSVKLNREWLANHVLKFTCEDKEINYADIYSLSSEFTSTLTEKGKEEVGKRIKEFEIFHVVYGWIKCYALPIN